MTLPVFEEYEPTGDCGCAGCADRRSAAPHALSQRNCGHLRARGARRALVLATAAGLVLGGGAAAAADPAPPAGLPVPASPATAPAGPGADVPGATGGTVSVAVADTDAADTPQPSAGTRTPAATQTSADTPVAARTPALSMPSTTRSAIISRAKLWVAAGVPYSTSKHWSDGYRQDCSGYVSMAWGLNSSEWTGSLARYGTRIPTSELRPGDILLFHNPANPTKGSHVTLFGGWANTSHTYYKAYEQTPPHARAQSTPYRYWTHSSKYVAYRYRGLATGSGGSGSSTAFPGTKYFGPGAKNAHVTRLGKMLVARGGGRFYKKGPAPNWGQADKRATQAFQRAQGWAGSRADGRPGPVTWRLLVTGTGKNIPAAKAAGRAATAAAPSGAGRVVRGGS